MLGGAIRSITPARSCGGRNLSRTGRTIGKAPSNGRRTSFRAECLPCPRTAGTYCACAPCSSERRLPTVRRSAAYKEPRGEREPHGSGLFHFDQGSLPAEHMACAQPDSAQFGVTIPKFRAPRIDIRKRGSKPLRYSEEHARRIHLWHKKAAARSSREASRCWLHLSPRTISPFQANHPIVRGGQSASHLIPNRYERGAKYRQGPATPQGCKVDGRPSSCLITLALSSRLPFHDLNGSRHSP